jgi:hypothetical protein
MGLLIINMNKKQEFKKLIQSNIDQYGYHVTVIRGGLQPRYAYTIGGREEGMLNGIIGND